MTDGMSESGFYFIRHGQTEANRDGVRSGGESDTHLTDLGREQARRAGTVLARLGVTPGLIVSSPLSRTVETAELLNAQLGLEIRVESELLERRLGAWNGQSVEATQPLLAARETPPGGESDAEFRARVLAAFRRLAPLCERWPLIVSSSGVARILIEHSGRVGAPVLPNGGIVRTILARHGEFEISTLDCVAPMRETA